MSTHALIGYQTLGGKFKFTYCHFDGYLEAVGQDLLTNYNDENSVIKLVENGPYRCILPAEKLENGTEYPQYLELNYEIFKKEPCAYVYVFKEGAWQYMGIYTNKVFEPLTQDAIKKESDYD